MNRLNNRAAALVVLLIAASALLLSGCQTTYIAPNDFAVAPKFAGNEWNARLLAAVKDGNLEAARECLSHKAKPSVYDCIGQSALMYACWNSDLPMVRLLCEHRKMSTSAVNKGSDYGYTALFCAAYKGNAAIMEYLVGKNAQFAREVRVFDNRNHTQTIIEIVRDRNGENILHKLAKSKSPEAVQEFIRNHRTFAGEDIWQRMSLEKDRNGYTPFHYAVIGGKVELVKLVLSLDKTKRVLNEGADDHTFPLYTAFEIRNLDIFRFMLEQPETKIHCRTPVKKTETEYQEMSVTTFSEKETAAKILTRAYSTNFFQSMYANRQSWEDDRKKGKLIIDDTELNCKIDELYETVCDGTKGTAELEEIKRELGSNISGISSCKGKPFDLLQQAIRTPRPIEQKLEVLSFLLDSGVSSRNQNDSTQALSYALDLASSSGSKDDIKVVEFLIRNHAKYPSAYSLNMPDDLVYAPWRQLLGSDFIRRNLEWEELKSLVSIIDRSRDFTSEFIREIFVYAVAGDGTTANNDWTWSERLFDLFLPKLNQEITVTPQNIPITTWMYQQGFYYGVNSVFENPNLMEKLKIKYAKSNSSNDTIKDILLRDTKSRNTDMKKMAEQLLQLYYAVYPEEDPSDQKNSSPQGRSHFRQKHDSP